MIRPQLGSSRKGLVSWVGLAIVASGAWAIVPGCSGGVFSPGDDGSCTVEGVVHEDGSTFPSSDGCNTCSCDNGQWGCTLIACVDDCFYQGQQFPPGATFPAGDGCNTCLCQDGIAVCGHQSCPVTCSYQGQTYQPGESFPAGDGCNTCSCGEDGMVACTEIACAATCTYAGVEYTPGQSFPALDGCNTCTCGADGTVGCTKMACQCNPDAEWYRDYVGHSPDECAVIDFACIVNTTYFQNACGCGCEQSPACPEWFDCMPPNPCDIDKIKAECPYSGIAL